MPFGTAHVRTPLEQFTWITDRKRLGNGRQLRWREVDAQCIRALAEQGGDAIACTYLFSLQLRYGGLYLRQPRIGTDDIEVIADPGIAQGFGDAARVLLGLEVGQGDLLAQLRTAQLAIGIDQFGDQADLQLLQVGLGHVLLGLAGFQLALDAAEQVQLPGHVQAQVVAFAVDPIVGLSRNLPLAQVAADTAGHGRQGIVADVVANCPGCLEAGKGHTQLAVALQRLADQLVEYWVIKLLPPGAFEATTVKRRPGVRLIGGAQLRRRSIRGLVVRPDGAGRQGQHQQVGKHKFQTVHAWLSSFSTRAALRAWLRST
ncbi:hypothetical protein D3C78_983110 [compost metagenome]